MSEYGYEGQVLDRQETVRWLSFSVHHPKAQARARRLGRELSVLIGDGWKIGARSSSSFTLMVRAGRTTTRSLKRRHSLFKTWLSPEVHVADDREWMEGPVRQAFARAGLADAAVEHTGDYPA